MSLVYRWWFPTGARPVPCPEAGDLVPFEHAVYRVISVRDLPEEHWNDQDRAVKPEFRKALRLRPVELADHPDPVKAASGDRHIASARHHSWHRYPTEHYPVCASCAEPLPCREELGRKHAEDAVTRMGRYELAGVCPACEKPVSARQKSITFGENLEVLGGPPVTFHLRRQCRYPAEKYEKRWAAADPENRRCRLSCPGHLTNHNDGTYGCTQLTDCPGPSTRHVSYSVCRCPDCHAQPWRWGRGCHPDPSARNLAFEAPQ